MSRRYGSVAYGGLDVHQKFSAVTLRDEAGRVVVRERLEHEDRGRLRAQVGRWPRGTALVLEASFGWGWLSDELEAAGMEVHLSNCHKVEKMRQARGQAKTNRQDADLVSLLPAEASRWWEVWRAPAAVRDRREWLRHRADLVALQTATKNRIHALCHRQGVYPGLKSLFGGRGRQFLLELAATGRHAGGPLAEGARAALQGQLRVLFELRDELAWIAGELRKQLEGSAEVRRLKTVPGFGLILSHVLVSEIGQIERFGSHKALASYAGLGPQSRDTGEEDPSRSPLGRRLPRRCQRTLKWAFIEAARGAVRKGGRWRELHDRVTQGGTKDRQRGYIKVARELVKVVFAVWRKQVDYQESPPARPGSPEARARRGGRNSRSGTGQLKHPMVPAAEGR